MSDREIQSVSPSSLATEEEMSCTGDPNACLVSHMFGAGYTLSTASAYVVATSFDAQMMGPAERSTDQPLIEWDWNIFPKSTGRQVINVGIDLQWTPTGKSGGTSILRQLWESPIAIEVDKPFFDAGQLTVSAAASGVFGTAFTGFSLQWMLEQRRQKREEKKKKIKYCQYCRAENPEDFEFCTNRYNHFCSVNTISRANGRSAIFCWKYGRSAGNSCIRLLSGKWKIGRSPEWYEMKEVKIMPFCIDCGNQEPEGWHFVAPAGSQ